MNEHRDIIKLFHEEPFYLEPLPPDTEPDARRQSTELGAIDALLPGDFADRPEPRASDDLSEDALDRPRPYYRLYLAGTDLARDRVGATALGNPEAWADALTAALQDSRWWVLRELNVVELEPRTVAALLAAPVDAPVVVAAGASPFAEPLEVVGSQPRRHTISALKRLLEDADAVLLREPAHDGFDWSIFSSEPLRERIESELARRLADGSRAFTAPYQKARSEERFYFERWALEEPPEWAEEIRGRKPEVGKDAG